MARQYYVEGTKSYLIAAAILAALSIWHIVDGWIPQARWRGAEATVEFLVNDATFLLSSREVGERFNGRDVQFLNLQDWDMSWGAVPEEAVVWAAPNDEFKVFMREGVRLADFERALADHRHFKIVSDEEQVDSDTVIDNLIGQTVQFSGGLDGQYPNFPEEWHDFSPQEFYAYNRWTGVLLGIAAIVCAYIHRVVR